MHNVYMPVASTPRKPLGVRATPEQHRTLKEAAARENRSVSSFVLRAALNAASSESLQPRKTPEEIQAAIKRAQALMRPYRQPGRSLVDELSKERRAEAARE